MCILFSPWRMFLDIKKPTYKSWKENFEQLYPSLSRFDKEIIKNINILYECKELRDADRLMQASENDTNKQTDRNKCEYDAINGLYDENVTDEQDHIFNEPIEIHENTKMEETFTTFILLQLEAEYFTCNSMKTNYTTNVCNLLGSMHDSKSFNANYETQLSPFGFSTNSQSKSLLKSLKALNKIQTCTIQHQALNLKQTFQVPHNQCISKAMPKLRQSDNIQQCDNQSCNTNTYSYIQNQASEALQDLQDEICIVYKLNELQKRAFETFSSTEKKKTKS
jgi:hypothetical protein